MKLSPLTMLGASLGCIATLSAQGRGEMSDLWAGEPDLTNPAKRTEIVQKMRQMTTERKMTAMRLAAQNGLKTSWKTDRGGMVELFDWREGQPAYRISHNASAAISTGANLLHTSPYNLNGSGITVGVWDGGAVRTTHVEMTGRVTVKDGAVTPSDHGTHVAGTIAASGVNLSAKGMAPAARIDSYDWNNDLSEMTSRGASTATDSTKLFLSNHSYGVGVGWVYVGLSTHSWEWFGTGTDTTGADPDFGRYHTDTRDLDSAAYNMPYYLIFRAAGNDRWDNPLAGAQVKLSSTSSVVGYDSTLHPPGDNLYRGGFETISFDELAKNVMTVGAVSDAVSGGTRQPGIATLTGFSSTGPTDDGRIKPDVVANGEFVFSSLAGTDSSYGSYNGTSMASPNACGSAALLVERYAQLYPGQSMRAAALKGLLIHTATDLGNAGPDYRYGWGLINVKEAADLLAGHAQSSSRKVLTDGLVSTSVASQTVSFTWDGVSPIRATLCWTDPAGNATTTVDSRTVRLVNNLNLKLVAPGGAQFLPYVMPFVGTWTQASMNSPATTGVNTVDNVEQVLLSAPPAPGVYQAVVTYTGSITNTTQPFALWISGSADTGPTPPSIVSITPDTGMSGSSVAFTLSGTEFASGATVKFTRSGSSDVSATVGTVTSTSISGTVPTAGMTSALWDVVVTNPNGQTAVLSNGFGVLQTLWTQLFEPDAPGWSASANIGTSYWALVTTNSHSPTHAWFASGPSTRNTDNLVSQPIYLPTDSQRMQVSFWHRYDTQATRDGGILEMQINGGTWTKVNNTGADEAITTGGYPSSFASSSSPTGNEFQGQPAWTGTNGSAFTQVVVSLKNQTKYAGTTLRMRWRLAVNNNTASPNGWYVDSLKLSGVGGTVNSPPTITDAASSSPNPISGTSALLNVLAADDGGEGNLIYAWTSTPNTVSFSENGTNAAKNVSAVFSQVGDYTLRVTANDAQGLSVESTVVVTVLPVPTTLTVTPANSSIQYGSTLGFSAAVADQFGMLITPSPTVTWDTSGGGTVSSGGLFTAQTVGGPFSISATVGSLSGSANITVTKAPALIALGNLEQIYDGTPKSILAATTPADLSLAILYDNMPTPPTEIGSYPVEVTITDPNYVGTASGMLIIGGLPIATWQSQHFSPTEISEGLAEDALDPDRDGYTNLSEYALGTNPREFSAAIPSFRDTTGLWTTFTRPKGLPDVRYIAESSADLEDWDPLSLEILTDGPTQYIRVRDPLTGPDTRRYLRVRFERP